MKRLAGIKSAFFLLASLFTFSAHGENIYCEGNKQMKCLGFGEKIVSSNTICFDPLKCSQEGFVCKSELNTLADEHKNLLNQHNELVNTHNQLIDAYESNQSDFERLQRCVAAATTLDEAKGCQ